MRSALAWSLFFFPPCFFDCVRGNGRRDEKSGEGLAAIKDDKKKAPRGGGPLRNAALTSFLTRGELAANV